MVLKYPRRYILREDNYPAPSTYEMEPRGGQKSKYVENGLYGVFEKLDKELYFGVNGASLALMMNSIGITGGEYKEKDYVKHLY